MPRHRRPGRLPRGSDNAIDWERYIENRKSAVRYKVEHPYRIIENVFGSRKTVYRGLRKNLDRLHVLFASTNLYMLARAGGSLQPIPDHCALLEWRGCKKYAFLTLYCLFPLLIAELSTVCSLLPCFNQRFLKLTE